MLAIRSLPSLSVSPLRIVVIVPPLSSVVVVLPNLDPGLLAGAFSPILAMLGPTDLGIAGFLGADVGLGAGAGVFGPAPLRPPKGLTFAGACALAAARCWLRLWKLPMS